ncbi:MAG: UvrD-helicase domain-containing protein [Bacteroidota bacterium]
METKYILLIVLVAIVIAIVIYGFIVSYRKNRQKNIIQRKTIVETAHSDIVKWNRIFKHFTSFNDGYFNHHKLITWVDSVSNIYDKLKGYDLDKLQLEPEVLSELKQFKAYAESGPIIRKDYNGSFIERELKASNVFFSNIEGQSLDLQQRLAVIRDEDNNLVIAGAGSGKTTTVAGKVAYVIERFKVRPEEILLITFTKKASDEMRHRIKDKMGIDIEVNTFHSFGRKIIGMATNNMPSVLEEKQLYSALKNIFSSLMADAVFAGKVIKFLTEYRLESKDVDDFKSHGEYIAYLKDNNITTYKTIEIVHNGKVTLLRETCKSEEEVKIANYLFLNGIEYKYEEPYKYPTADNQYAQYKPDFYLPDYDIYIEHFALIDTDNNVPGWFRSDHKVSAKEKYNSDIDWKRKKHIEHSTTLIETYSYEKKQGILLEKFKEKLEARGVVFRQRTNDEIWDILNSIANDEVSALETLIHTFLNLLKSNNGDPKTLLLDTRKNKDNNIRRRQQIFLEIFTPILSRYNDYLRSNHLIDFSDMINDATRYISDNRFRNHFKYIIIDEFQDTSMGRFNLIKALLKNNRSCKLFAVGDDWQSIFRFAGSDISLFTQFEKHFGITELSKIETTYRFNKSMIDISSRFILANPNQTPKKLKPFGDDTVNPIEVIQSHNTRNDDPLPFINVLHKIKSENTGTSKKLTILALARYNHIIKLYRERTDLFLVGYNETDKSFVIKYRQIPEYEVQFLSVHRSKGLQADYVIILNCVSGQYGFPSEQADDPILNLLLSGSDQFVNGEERRLFYVALTRSKRKTFITTNAGHKSKFINEVDPNYTEDSVNKCPICKKGNKVLKEGTGKNGKPYKKYSCSNWNYGCEYLAWG